MSNITEMGIPTLAEIPAEKILASAQEQSFVCCFVLGTTESGELYFASTTGDPSIAIYHAEKFKHMILENS